MVAAVVSQNSSIVWFSGLPAPVRGALWMTGGAIALAGMNGVIRQVVEVVHPIEAAFFRSLFGLVFMLPWLWHKGFAGLRTRRLGLYGLRTVFTAVSMFGWFIALTLLPLAEVVAYSFTAPLIAAVGAAFVLGETIRVRRWSAIGAGFIGVIIMLRPGYAELSLGAIVALLTAITMAVSMLCIKVLSRTEPAEAIVTYMVIFLTPVTFVPALFVWQWPPFHVWPWLVAMGAIGTLGHICLARAFAAADASVVLPFDYLRLPFVALIGYVFFAEVPTVYTWIGALVIAAASGYLAHREAQLARARQASGVTRHGPVAGGHP